jgi:2'-5' RNA ligase
MRSFLAVALREPALSEAGRLLDELAAAIPRRDCRWVRGEGLHLTLHFFGELDDGRVGEVLAAVGPVAAATRPFELALGGLGSFPPRRDPRVLWLGVTAGEEPLAALARGCQARLHDAGFAVDQRPYSAHCTLGRPRPGWPAAARAAWTAAVGRQPVIPPFTATAVTLFDSRPQPSGAVYEAVAELPLGGS